MTVIYEGKHAGEFIISEEENLHCRDAVLVAASQVIVPGQIMGTVMVNEGTITVAANAFTGTGNGTLTPASPAYGPGVQEGTYTTRLIEAGANTGQFEVRRPDGTIDGFAVVGTLYDGQLRFTIADGATDFAAGAQFTQAVTIAEAADVRQFKALNLAAADGAEVGVAIAVYGVTTGVGQTASISAMVRGPAQVRRENLTYAAGIDAAGKAAQDANLAQRGIIVRPII